MASLTVWKFDTADGAAQALAKVQDLAKQQLIVLDDAATVSWPQGKKKPKTHQAQSMTGAGALAFTSAGVRAVASGPDKSKRAPAQTRGRLLFQRLSKGFLQQEMIFVPTTRGHG